MSQSTENVSSEFPFTLHRQDVLESYMTYVDTEKPTPKTSGVALFLHGNPTSSYLWRNIIPHLSSQIRCVAPDNIGMGHSGKPKIAYRFVDHAEYLEAFISAVVPTGKVVLVMSDWGSVLGFNWAYHHQDRIAGLVFSEFLRPFPEFLPGFEIFRAFRDPEIGPKLLISENAFIEKVLPAGIVRGLTQVEHDYYRAPFFKEEDRQPIYRFPNEIPIEGQPADVWRIVETYHEWLLESGLPKLFFWAEPGKIVSEEMAGWYMERLKNVRGVNVGAGIHDIQEDQPHKMGSEISGWLDEVEL